MVSANVDRPALDPPRLSSGRDRLLAVALVFVSFLADSAVRMPVPAPNEPHYLAKARHYWTPGWCPGDFFLDSADAHPVFFFTVGWMTQWVTLAQTAWIGRIAALLLLAVGWCAMVSRIVPGRWSNLWGAWMFLAIAAVGNLSGEWIVGGVEAKVFTYGLLFWGLALLWDGRRIPAAICGGLAVAFHPVVGIWGVLCAMFAAGVLVWSGAPGRARPLNDKHSSSAQTVLRRCVLPIGVLGACALPGLIPALQLVLGVPEDLAFRAEYIQVFFRLRHHLDPMEFPRSAYVGYAVLAVFWVTIRHRAERTEQERFFAWVVGGTAAFALAGFLIGLGPRPAEQMPGFEWRMTLLKFYPFRLFDVMLPIAAALTAVGLVTKVRNAEFGNWNSAFRIPHSAFGWLVFGAALAAALLLPAPNRNPSRMSLQQHRDWLTACRWIEENTPEDALFLTPTRQSWAFKWYAQRAEYVSYKDCPQNAAGIVEWNRRLNFVRDWAQQHYRDQLYSADELWELQRKAEITHIIADHLGPFAIEPIFENRTYRVYELSFTVRANLPEIDAQPISTTRSRTEVDRSPNRVAKYGDECATRQSPEAGKTRP